MCVFLFFRWIMLVMVLGLRNAAPSSILHGPQGWELQWVVVRPPRSLEELQLEPAQALGNSCPPPVACMDSPRSFLCLCSIPGF